MSENATPPIPYTSIAKYAKINGLDHARAYILEKYIRAIDAVYIEHVVTLRKQQQAARK